MITPFKNAANEFASQLSSLLYGNSTLQDWPDKPRVVLTATNLQCGSPFRFSKRSLVDHRLGEIRSSKLSVSVAVAASAAMPPILSPPVLDFRQEEWTTYEVDLDPKLRTEVYPTDGMVHDYYAIEAAWEQYSTILVSDGSLRIRDEPKPDNNWIAQSSRILDVQSQSMRNLRKRQLIEAFLERQRTGAFWSISTSVDDLEVSEEIRDASWINELSAIPTRFAAIDDRNTNAFGRLGLSGL